MYFWNFESLSEPFCGWYICMKTQFCFKIAIFLQKIQNPKKAFTPKKCMFKNFIAIGQKFAEIEHGKIYPWFSLKYAEIGENQPLTNYFFQQVCILPKFIVKN